MRYRIVGLSSGLNILARNVCATDTTSPAEGAAWLTKCLPPTTLTAPKRQGHCLSVVRASSEFRPTPSSIFDVLPCLAVFYGLSLVFLNVSLHVQGLRGSQREHNP